MGYEKINLKYYSKELQEIIELLLKKDYKERPDIENIYNKIKNINELLNKNEISMIINIKDNDVDKDIYFLDNYFYDENGNKNEFHNGLKEMNETNVELYIDDIKYKYKKYHKFSKGYHKIKIILKNKNKRL